MFLLLVLGVSACAPVRRAPLATPGESPSVSPVTGPAAGIKIGTPYQVNGVWYYPRVQPEYDEAGIASWYGEPFHGRRTANGEIFDMNALTAAHPTLPLPSMVRITNLQNGRSLVLRVNDRGPFHNGRIIDVSRRGAQLLGFIDRGTARVRVTLLSGQGGTEVAVVPKPVTTAEERDALPAVPREPVATRPLPPPEGRPIATEAAPPPPRPGPAAAAAAGRSVMSKADPAVTYVPVQPTGIFVQAGAFVDYDRALRVGDRLQRIGPARVTRAVVNGQGLFRVRLGPWAEVAEADAVLQQVIASGINDARIIVE